MPNSIPYFALIFVSLMLFTLSWRKAANKKLICLYLCMAGFIYYFEFIVLVVLKGYVYIPQVFKDPYIDNVFGANVSDGFIVPLTTVFIAVFDLSIGWIVFIVLCFLGIEWLFLYLGVYKHYWWKTIYTGFNLPIQFALGKWVWNMIRFHAKRFFVRFGVLYFASATIHATFLYYFSAIFHLVFYRVNWFNEATRGHIAFEAIFAFIVSIFFASVVVAKAYWLWSSILIVCVASVNLVLYKWGILEVPGNWAIVLLTMFQASVLFILKHMKKILLGENWPS